MLSSNRVIFNGVFESKAKYDTKRIANFFPNSSTVECVSFLSFLRNVTNNGIVTLFGIQMLCKMFFFVFHIFIGNTNRYLIYNAHWVGFAI